MTIGPVAKLGQIPLEEKVQKGSNYRDNAEWAHLLPAWRNRCCDNVGRELESQTRDKPTSIPYQDFAEPVVRRRGRKRRPQSNEKCLGGADRDNDQCHRIDDDDNVSGNEM